MTYRVALSERAKNDLREIYTYIALNLFAPNSASKLLSRLKEAICSLNLFPEAYPVYEAVGFAEHRLRMMPVGRYRVFYLVDHKENSVYIVRVLFERQDVEKELKQ